ncbi:MAG: hypothetical protein JXO49_00305 [Deltaproteobacteria bacterium]|nr:hypothetical protein [Candidatus Anaeroferrophillus wilburensis]MBN2887765.1 hypothetical protein [Deltaproteobacteria bacterium]
MKKRTFLLFIVMALPLFSLPMMVVAQELSDPPPGGNELLKKVPLPTADHRKFKQLKEEFKRGPEVTRACLGCHTEAAKQVQHTIHWTWGKKKGQEQQAFGKAYTLNSF